MTTGEIIFYAGAALFAITILLAIVFAIKKPQYKPENAAYIVSDAGSTQRLRNGYPTDRLTIRAEPKSEAASGTLLLDEQPEQMQQAEASQETVLLDETQAEETVLLAEETVLLDDGTMPLEKV